MLWNTRISLLHEEKYVTDSQSSNKNEQQYQYENRKKLEGSE